MRVDYVFNKSNITICIVAICLLANHIATAQKHQAEIDSLEKVLTTLPQDTNRVNTLIKLCRVLQSSSTKKVLEVANEAVVVAQNIDFGKGEGKAYVYIGYYYHRLGNSPQAIEYLLKALSIFERIHDNQQIAVCNNNVGIIYLSQDDTKAALTHFKKALAAWSNQGYKSGVARALSNIADVYEIEKRDSLALDYYNQSLKLNEEIKDKAAVSNDLTSIGDIYFRSKDYERAHYYQQKALQLAIETESVYLQPSIYISISKLRLVQNRPQEAMMAAELGLKAARAIDFKRDIADSYYQLAKAYEALKNYPMAYTFQSLYVVLNDSIKSSEGRSNIERIKSSFELKKKELELKALDHELTAKILRRNSFIAACLALLIIGGFIFKRQRAIMKKKLDSKRQLLDFYTQNLREKSEMIDKVNLELETLKTRSFDEDPEIDKFNKILHSAILTDDDWENFKKAFEEVYPRFFAKIRYHYPDITVSELRLSALIKLKLSLKESASMLGISPESIKKSRYRLKKKFDLPEKETLEDFINKITFLKAAS
ncbi:tetratricopeptide repeat protein [Ohtaekwangia koreensis]|uniref:Tetratricopeptide repeat-containing protein n=1 Tax=Ohtaekwangia koreensis TaxID=688867 RepID=A0A1T5LNG6_9BACT|nr:tetratricopeptide repeat protein [Ohtaekwangia koreensis]SKC77451.1 Tetratricopeptide repeat-containing protein [Ohtaekwangia koreensis]